MDGKSERPSTERKARPFPPVPDWRPEIRQPIDRIVDRFRYYTDGKSDFAVFRHGTCVLLEADLSDQEAESAAKKVLHEIFHAHPDMKWTEMDDGNIMVHYNHPAANIVLADLATTHWEEIRENHLRALATSEVLWTPAGWNAFDDSGKKALFGRCFMFMDVQDPQVVQIVRRST